MKFASVLFFLTLSSIHAFQISSTTHRRSVTSLKASSLDAHDTRRSFLQTCAMGTVASMLFQPPPAAHAAASSVDYKAVASDIAELVKKNPDWGPTLVRLAWHSSGTYDKESKTGGSYGGTIRFQSELAHGGNAGLGVTAVQWLEPLHEKYSSSGLSYADLYTLAGGKRENSDLVCVKVLIKAK